MAKRRQALCSRELLATSVFFSLILVFFFALPSILVRAEPAWSGASAAIADGKRATPGDMNTGPLLLQSEDGGLVKAPRLATDVMMAVNGTIARVTVTQRFALVLALLSAVTFILWRHHRRDYASPRRIGRRT